MIDKTPIKGMITDVQFKAQYPEMINTCNRAVTVRGDTHNTWIQHDDGSWTNIACNTVPKPNSSVQTFRRKNKYR